ncbi:MAG: S41 family peptidase [Bacteroidota bacterium]
MSKRLNVIHFTLVFVLCFNTCFSLDFINNRGINHTQFTDSTPAFLPVKKSELKQIVNRISDSLKYYYVSIEEGVEAGNYIKNQLENGAYDSLKDPKQLAEKLTEDLRSVHGDLHLFVSHREQNSSQSPSHGSTPNNRYEGLSKVSFMEDNIYVKFTDFGDWNNANDARQTITKLAPLFENKNALIIDVRDNLGGVPYVVSHLLSYFFDKTPKKLANYFIRYNDTNYSIYTEPNVSGTRLPDLPIYVLVNEKTASAGEELAFWLQGQNRATVIGQNTIGAGYGAMEHRLNERFFISISNETEVDPVTNKGFQITGVKPHIVIENEKALDKAMELIEAKAQSGTPDLSLEGLRERISAIDVNNIGTSISQLITRYHTAGVINHSAINELGYAFMHQPKKAVAILRMNTILYSFYPNSFDSYADALVANKQYELAKTNYEKAVELAELKSNRNLAVFQENQNNFLATYRTYNQNLKAIREVLNHYIQGTSAGEPERLDIAFHDDLNLYSIDGKTKDLKIWPGRDYKKIFKKGEKNNRIGRIVSIDVENNIAMAKVEITRPNSTTKFIDFMMLLKIKDQWKIVHKSYTKIPI